MRPENEMRTLKSHWDSLETMLARLDEVDERSVRSMKRAYYAGAMSMMTVMKIRAQEQMDAGTTPEQGTDMITELTKEALQGMVDSIGED